MSAPDTASRRLRIAIIGAGPGGLCMAIRLKQAGFEDFVVLERGQGVGGTWYHNRYPGCACDIEAHLYSYSFEIKHDWSRPYAPQPEILEYVEACAEKYGVLPYCRFGQSVRGATWDPERALWVLAMENGETFEAEVVVGAIGMFNELNWPDIPGLDAFEGTQFHSARWNWDHDLTGRTVGVIGSAASAVQFIPEITKTAGQVYLYQRSANWVLPKLDDPYTEEQLEHFRQNPEESLALRQAIYDRVDQGMTFSNPEALEEFETYGLQAIEIVEDEAVRQQLRPQHPFGCKRPLFSNDYFAAFNRPNLELVTEPIERITRDGIVSGSGNTRPVDTLVLATGFSATKYLSAIEINGRDGRRLDEAWSDGAHAYLGITTSGFPNLFMLYGPNTNNGSIISMIESQVEHILLQVQRMEREGLAWIDVRPEPMADYNEAIQEAIAGVTVWQDSCNGYYRAPSGRVVTQWPHSMSHFRERTGTLEPEAFEVASRST